MSKGQLLAYWELITEYNLDPGVWDQIKENTVKSHRQGESIPIQFWVAWGLVQFLIRTVNGDEPMDLEKTTTEFFYMSMSQIKRHNTESSSSAVRKDLTEQK